MSPTSLGTIFKVSIVKAAVKSCGQKVTGGFHSCNFKILWWKPDVKGAVKLKEEAFQAGVVCRNS